MQALTRILYVDDSRFDRELVRHVLEHEHGGFEIIEAASQQEFEARLADNTYDLVLTDFNILGFEGFQVLDAVRDKDPRIPVVIVTGTGSEEVAVEAMKRGVSDYVIKTSKHIQRLPLTILTAIERSRMAHERDLAAVERKSRTRQQEVVTYLGQRALARTSLDLLMDEAATLVTETLDLPYCRVLTYQPETETFRLKAAVGWPEVEVGAKTFSAAAQTQAGYTLKARTPVIVKDFSAETRFTTLPLAGAEAIEVASGMSVIIQGQDAPLGVLTAHTTAPTAFTGNDLHFLQAVANVLSMAIERKQFEQDLIAAKEKAEEMSHLKSAFLTNMSHEIRTPLTSIIGFASILSSEVPEEHRSLIHLIEQSGHRLLNTLNAVLDLSMLEAGTLTLSPQPLNLVEEVQDKVHLLYPVAAQKGLQLSIIAPNDTVYSYLDRACLDRVLQNLIGNAIKFTTDGAVTIEVLSTDDEAAIRIKDTGLGISQAFMPYLFDAFKQESMGIARSHEGSGLGLTVTQRFVSLMHGDLQVESQKGAGSTFSITFSRHRLEPAEPTVGSWRSLAVQPSGPRPYILAVEDNEETLIILRRFLTPLYDVDLAEDEKTALALLRQHSYDLVLMDINLGRERTGADVLQDLRTLPGYGAVPVIAATAYAMPGDREHFIKQGFSSYISKPFTKQQLLDKVARVLHEQASPGPAD